jgi:hypothetical protein
VSSFRLSPNSTWTANSSLFLDVFQEFRSLLNEYLDGAEAVRGFDLSVDVRPMMLELLKSAALSVARVREDSAQPSLVRRTRRHGRRGDPKWHNIGGRSATC